MQSIVESPKEHRSEERNDQVVAEVTEPGERHNGRVSESVLAAGHHEDFEIHDEQQDNAVHSKNRGQLLDEGTDADAGHQLPHEEKINLLQFLKDEDDDDDADLARAVDVGVLVSSRRQEHQGTGRDRRGVARSLPNRRVKRERQPSLGGGMWESEDEKGDGGRRYIPGDSGDSADCDGEWMTSGLSKKRKRGSNGLTGDVAETGTTLMNSGLSSGRSSSPPGVNDIVGDEDVVSGHKEGEVPWQRLPPPPENAAPSPGMTGHGGAGDKHKSGRGADCDVEVLEYIRKELASIQEGFTFKCSVYQQRLKHFLAKESGQPRSYVEGIVKIPSIPTSEPEQIAIIKLRQVCESIKVSDWEELPAVGKKPKTNDGDEEVERSSYDFSKKADVGLLVNDIGGLLTSLVNKVMFLIVVQFNTWYIHQAARENLREELLRFIWPDAPHIHTVFRSHFQNFVDVRIRHFRDSVARYFRDSSRNIKRAPSTPAAPPRVALTTPTTAASTIVSTARHTTSPSPFTDHPPGSIPPGAEVGASPAFFSSAEGRALPRLPPRPPSFLPPSVRSPGGQMPAAAGGGGAFVSPYLLAAMKNARSSPSAFRSPSSSIGRGAEMLQFGHNSRGRTALPSGPPQYLNSHPHHSFGGVVTEGQATTRDTSVTGQQQLSAVEFLAKLLETSPPGSLDGPTTTTTSAVLPAQLPPPANQYFPLELPPSQPAADSSLRSTLVAASREHLNEWYPVPAAPFNRHGALSAHLARSYGCPAVATSLRGRRTDPPSSIADEGDQAAYFRPPTYQHSGISSASPCALKRNGAEVGLMAAAFLSDEGDEDG